MPFARSRLLAPLAFAAVVVGSIARAEAAALPPIETEGGLGVEAGSGGSYLTNDASLRVLFDDHFELGVAGSFGSPRVGASYGSIGTNAGLRVDFLAGGPHRLTFHALAELGYRRYQELGAEFFDPAHVLGDMAYAGARVGFVYALGASCSMTAWAIAQDDLTHRAFDGSYAALFGGLANEQLTVAGAHVALATTIGFAARF